MSEVAIPLVLLIGWLAAMLWHAVAEDGRQAALEAVGPGGVSGEALPVTSPADGNADQA